MKKAMVYFFLLAMLTNACADKSKKLVKKWQMKQMEIAGQKLDGKAVEGFSFDIREDGTYTLVGMIEEKGTWQLSENKDSLITMKDQKNIRSGVLITDLSDDNLILTGNSEGTNITLEFMSPAK